MSSMQRSLSSPVCIQSSPPASPTIPSQLSRHPSPSAEVEQNVGISRPTRPRRFTSRSPTRAQGHTGATTTTTPTPTGTGTGTVTAVNSNNYTNHNRTISSSSSHVQTQMPPQTRRSEDSSHRSLSQRPPSPATGRRPAVSRAETSQSSPKPASSRPIVTQASPTGAGEVGSSNAATSSSTAAAAAVAAVAAAMAPDSPPAPPVPLDTKPSAKPLNKPLIMPQPLISDVSLYANAHVDLENDSTTLDELAHLVRLSKFQERKRADTRLRLHRSLISTALFARLTRCGEVVHRHLYDSFRQEDKKSFATVYNAFIDVRNSCEATRRYAALDRELEALSSPSSETIDAASATIGATIGGSVNPFLSDLSAESRDAFLGFLTSLRTNPDYLATRLCSLSSAELAAFVNFNQTTESESVLPGGGPVPRGGRTGSLRRTAGHISNSTASRNNPTQTPTAVEKLLSFQRHDPLATLLYSCFANSAGPESTEDRRRTDIWATAIARLVTSANHTGINPNASPDHQIMASALSAWASIREWAGKSKMEWFLMKILEEGSFILGRAEDPNGTMFNVSVWTPEDIQKADQFYDRAVQELFDILDDEDATGIPEGAVELGQQILRKLDGRFMDHTRQWFVYQWLFADWLFRVMVSPESFGMMINYNITPYGREKILKAVAGKAQSLVTAMLPTWEKGHATAPRDSPPSKIVDHVDNILARFKPSRSRKLTTRLLPARSVTSLRETAEVRPYLIISPADLATMVNALFPEPRPRSPHNSIRSGAPSVSNFSTISQPMSVLTSRFDMQSVISTSYSSAMSDATSQETVDEHMYQRNSPDNSNQTESANYEDDGAKLRYALREMTNVLGADTVRGSCHPCAERWAVIFLSPDGRSLSTQMTFDPDDDVDDENSSTTSDSDDEAYDAPELDRDYHQLRDSILKLVEEYEIPQDLGKGGNKFSNRASSLKKYKSRNKIITAERTMQSNNPYRKLTKVEEEEEPPNVLIAMLQAASSQSKAQSDFVSSHLYWKTLQQLNALASPSLVNDGFASLLNIFSRGPRDSIRRSAAAIEEYDAWLVWLKQSQERHDGLIGGMMTRLKSLRDMTWYATDVRTSKPYEESLSVCKALRTMGSDQRWEQFRKTRPSADRGVSARYLQMTNTQVIDMIAAPEDQGGPNKLTDEHTEIALKWLQHHNIENNFCRGEERIHRLCYEIDSCVNKLLGTGILDGPVLWASELYAKDEKMLENANGGNKGRDIPSSCSVMGDDVSSVVSDPLDRRSTFSSSRPGSIARDLRSMSHQNTSQHSFESGRYSFPRPPLSDVLDSHDYFGVGSPVKTMDSASTFYSPFNSQTGQSVAASRAHSPTTSITNLSSTLNNSTLNMYGVPPSSGSGRPGTSASSSETVFAQRASEDKQRFLTDLRQSLTSLLISDLGHLVFAQGSETDEWFSTIGQAMIERKEYRRRMALKRERAKDRVAKTLLKPRIIEKKKSIGDLRNAHDGGSEASDNTATMRNDSSATSDTIGRSRARKKEAGPEFPFTKAYQRLLSKFCVHPNPYAKLDALHDLERLIVESLASGSKRSRLALGKADLANLTINENEATGRSKPLEDAIDNVRERRSQTVFAPLTSSLPMSQPRTTTATNMETRSVMSVISPVNTDAIANVLQSLFRDANIRPRTLFRDLQFIASFVPPHLLDKTEKGKAFWDTALAALSLKQEVCCTMVEVADEVNKGTLEVRRSARQGTGSGGSDAGSSASGYMGMDPTSALPSPSLPTYTARDAARMMTIAAKEGDPTAQRELAFSFLMQAELLDRVTLPLSRPRDVFKQALIDQYAPARQHHGSNRTENSIGDVNKNPAHICLALHWAAAAHRGGDELAGQFIRQHLEADKGVKG